MKLLFTIILFSSIVLFSCRQKESNSKIFILDSSLSDTSRQLVHFISDKHASQFKTAIEVRYYLDNQIVDSIVQPDYVMTSWYSAKNDTIDLVAHIGEFETDALLLRFVSGHPQVFHYRAAHSEQNYFRFNITDSLTDQIEIPAIEYKLSLSQIPDAITKSVVFGQIEMESAGYYDKRDTLQKRHTIIMRFNFRAKYVDFYN